MVWLTVCLQKRNIMDKKSKTYPQTGGELPGQSGWNRQILAPIIFLSVLSVLLAVAAGLALRSAFTETKLVERAVDEKVWYQAEYDKLMIQLTELELAYEELSAENIELHNQFQEQREEISHLRRQIQRSLTPQQIRRYTDRISELESILLQYQEDRSFIKAEHEVLIRENQQMASSLNQAAERNQLLESENRILNEKVEIAKKLQLSAITISAYRNIDRMRVTDRARRVSAIGVCFDVRSNLLAEQGERTIYFQIIGPENRVLTDTPDTNFEWMGTNHRYTFSEQFVWSGSDKNLCSNWTISRDLLPGFYQLVIFFEGHQYEPLFFELK